MPLQQGCVPWGTGLSDQLRHARNHLKMPCEAAQTFERGTHGIPPLLQTVSLQRRIAETPQDKLSSLFKDLHTTFSKLRGQLIPLSLRLLQFNKLQMLFKNWRYYSLNASSRHTARDRQRREYLFHL